MSASSTTTSTSFNFEAIFNAALTEYTKRTGKDLRDHPLASKIDSCDNPESILDIFQEQAQAFDKFRNGDTKLFKWLRPVINVLHAISTNKTISDTASNVTPATSVMLFLNNLSSRCFRPQRQSSLLSIS
jgi:fungal STAND N-terminal Goodbye domain